MTIYYKEMRSAASINMTNNGTEATRTYNQVLEDKGCVPLPTVAPKLGDVFSADQLTLKIVSIQTVPHGIEHAREGTNKNLNQYICSYSTTPSPTVYDESWISAKYTGGTSIMSLDLKQNGSKWWWLKKSNSTTIYQQILKRSVFLLEAKGTYSITFPLPNVSTGDLVPWGQYLTGAGAGRPFGINQSVGKINATTVLVSPIETLAAHTFKKGQLMLASYDCSPAVGVDGVAIFMVTLNFAYRVVDLDENNINVDYPWLYLINDVAEGETGIPGGGVARRYQLPTTSKTNEDDFPKNGNFMYDTIDFGSSLNPRLIT